MNLKITCPSCRNNSLALVSLLENRIECQRCSVSYPVKEMVIDLLPDSKQQRTMTQFLMEWRPFINIYESRLWRRNFATAAVMGITFADEFKTIIGAADVKDGDSILDLACGSGLHARQYAKNFPESTVVGLDLSLNMLKYASAKAKYELIHNLALIRGSALDIPFPDNYFDAVTCCFALHMFPDRGRAIAEVGRVLKSGGRFVAITFKTLIPGDTGKKISRLQHQIAGFSSFQPEELNEYLEGSGFENFKIHHAKSMGLIASAVKM
ncbi:MAG: methyltransferase domain-containing protein [Spirochaetes bacterium]|nr:methyltransferase domain-containing protein [Spirochaetota bacterium]